MSATAIELFPKKDLIDAYGHFYVLCNASDWYLSRVRQPSGYNWIGNLDVGWKPRPVTRLAVLEFLGNPPYGENDNFNFGVLNDIKFEDDKKNIFSTAESAVTAAVAIETAQSAMYEQLRDIGKTRTLNFDMATPTLETEHRLLPDEMRFFDPKQFCKGGVLYATSCNVADRPITVCEAHVFQVKLTPVGLGNTQAEPFHCTYKMMTDMSLELRPDFAPVLERTFMFDPQSEHNGISYYPPHSGQMGSGVDVIFSLTHKRAEQRAEEVALAAYRNISAHLPRPTIPSPK